MAGGIQAAKELRKELDRMLAIRLAQEDMHDILNQLISRQELLVSTKPPFPQRYHFTNVDLPGLGFRGNGGSRLGLPSRRCRYHHIPNIGLPVPSFKEPGKDGQAEARNTLKVPIKLGYQCRRRDEPAIPDCHIERGIAYVSPTSYRFSQNRPRGR